MAQTIGDLIINLVFGNEAGLKGELTRAGTAAGDAAGVAGSKAMGKSFQKGMGVVAGIAAIAIGAFAVGSIDAAKNWETAFTGVKKTFDDTGLSAQQTVDALADVEDGLRDMAKEIPTSVEELAALAEAGGALGIARDDLLEFTKTAAILDETTDVAATDAATALGKIGAVMPFTREEYSRFAATLVDLGNKGASTESEIISMSQNMAGAAALVGLSKAELLGWASALSNVGEEAEAGGSSFQRFALEINSVVGATTEIERVARIAGVSVGDLVGAIEEGGAAQERMSEATGVSVKRLKELVATRSDLDTLADLAGVAADEFSNLWSADASQAMQRVIEGLGEMDAQTRQATLAALGFKDIRITRALLALTNNVDNLNSALDIAPKAWGENTAASEEFRKRLETVDSKLDLARAAIHDMAITVGTVLLPVVKDIAMGISTTVNAITEWMEANPDLVATLVPLTTALAALVAVKWGARLMTSLLPIPGTGGVLARALVKVLEETGANTALTGAASGLGGKLGGLIQAGVVAGLTLGLAVLIQQAVEKVVTETFPDIPMTFKWEPPQDQIGSPETAAANQAGADAIIARRARERVAAEQAAYLAAWDAAWKRTPLDLSRIDFGLPLTRVFEEGGRAAGEAGARAAAEGWTLVGDAVLVDGIPRARSAAERLAQESVDAMTLGYIQNITQDWDPAYIRIMQESHIKAINAQRSLLGVLLPGAFAVMPKAASDAGDEAGENLWHSLVLGLAQGEQPVKSAMADLRWALENPLAGIKLRSRIEGALTGEELAKGLRSRRPWIREEAERAKAALIGQWELATDRSWDHGLSIADNLARGMKRNRGRVTTEATATATAATRPLDAASDAAFNDGKEVASRFAAGIAARTAEVTGAGTGLGKALYNAIHQSSPAKEGPLSKDGGTFGWGAKAGILFAQGLITALGDVRTATATILSPLSTVSSLGLSGLHLAPMSAASAGASWSADRAARSGTDGAVLSGDVLESRDDRLLERLATALPGSSSTVNHGPTYTVNIQSMRDTTPADIGRALQRIGRMGNGA